jgi:hypothetical protein
VRFGAGEGSGLRQTPRRRVSRASVSMCHCLAHGPLNDVFRRSHALGLGSTMPIFSTAPCLLDQFDLLGRSCSLHLHYFGARQWNVTFRLRASDELFECDGTFNDRSDIPQGRCRR